MELSDFAATVLGSPRLEDKLLDPGVLTDFHPTRHAAPRGGPGRPLGAELGSDASPPVFPNPGSLTETSGRALALHFFANHELMALELMALTLLRFPDVEPEFRMGVARTMLDEQRHFRLYRQRGQELGIGFGEVGVNSYFWNALSGISKPLDYVTVLSMTLEQANLDFARWYGAEFTKLGDSRTASIMGAIYEDEIEHLAYGVRWFERWRKPGQDLWGAWVEALPPGVDPSQARGKGFSAEGRRRAGLPEDYIRRVASLSRRRLDRSEVPTGGGWRDRWLGFGGAVPERKSSGSQRPSSLPKPIVQSLLADLGASPPPEATEPTCLRFSLHPSGRGLRRSPIVTRREPSATPGVLALSVGRPWDGLSPQQLRSLNDAEAPRESPLRAMRRVASRAAGRLHAGGLRTQASLDFGVAFDEDEPHWWLEGLCVSPGAGRFAAQLQPRLTSDALGLWLEVPWKLFTPTACPSPRTLLDRLDVELPQETVGEPGQLRLRRGALPTSDPGSAGQQFSVLLAGDDRAQLMALVDRLLATG